jgi:hypothetical protein
MQNERYWVTSPPQLLNPWTTSHALLRPCLHDLAPTKEFPMWWMASWIVLLQPRMTACCSSYTWRSHVLCLPSKWAEGWVWRRRGRWQERELAVAAMARGTGWWQNWISKGRVRVDGGEKRGMFLGDGEESRKTSTQSTNMVATRRREREPTMEEADASAVSCRLAKAPQLPDFRFSQARHTTSWRHSPSV